MHLITQPNQTCCERCGDLVKPGFTDDDDQLIKGGGLTDDVDTYSRQIDRCDNKPAIWPSDRLVPRSIEDVPVTFTVDGKQVQAVAKTTTTVFCRRCDGVVPPMRGGGPTGQGALCDQCLIREGYTSHINNFVPITTVTGGAATQPETVNHPNHYGGDTVYETIKVILAWGLDFEIGNAVKYLSRAGKKDPAKEIEDLRKAVFYIEHKIKRLSK